MNLGDTSFRRKNLLDDYKVMLQGITEQLEEWNINNSLQMAFYQKWVYIEMRFSIVITIL